ncbi:hemolysin family protein [Falsarthrobacter nasiphocae]|uniref:CBS domain containing-hemolysin-like protein n=1 Tax=Falsarthrobacter nasiphocae TaxID=189863 RepID=A0AAE3YFA1_9MICC|nr:hemolysin family protein [Falsarthrobacter nasiphocae]MDR6892743.1 CBS domain containing-hemolysin-like protein [Falsarthrobacter nasiphocae]
MILIGLVLIAGTGFFVAVEFALVAIDQSAVQRAIADGDTRAEPLLRCLKTLSTQLSSCQLGITLTTLLTGYVFEPGMSTILGQATQSVPLPPGVLTTVSFLLSMTLATFISMILGELVPKNLSIAKPFAVGRALAPAQLAFTAVFRPLVYVMNGAANRALHGMGLEAKEELSSARTPQELQSMVRHSAEAGTLDEETATFLTRTLLFSDRVAADVMTPRVRLETVGHEDSVEDVIAIARRTGYSRFPIIGESADEVLGVVHVKKAVQVPRERRQEIPAMAIRQDIVVVPETVELDELLTLLRESNLQFALVLDEYGGTAGALTLEDLVEEIVGEVADEHDRIKPGVLQSVRGDWYFPAMLRPDEISSQIRVLDIPTDGSYETVGGFVMKMLGRIPARGDAIELPGGTLTVERMDGRRVDRVRFHPAPEPQDENDDDATPRPVSAAGKEASA